VRIFIISAILFILFLIKTSLAQELNVAAASNFKLPLSILADKFSQNTKHKINLIFGATGKHYAQIKNGAPYDIFFAADSLRPKLLETEGTALAGSRFTYALGKLALWSPEVNYVDNEGRILASSNFKRLALANPTLAPYGKAAQQTLIELGLWDRLKTKIVRGENIGQTFQFVKSASAKLGFIAYSQISNPDNNLQGSFWLVPQKLYQPIEQQAVILTDSQAAQDFIKFIKSKQALQIIHSYGYDTSHAK